MENNNLKLEDSSREDIEKMAHNTVEKLWGMPGMHQRQYLNVVEKLLSERWSHQRKEIEENAKNFSSQFEDFKYGDSPRAEMKEPNNG